MTDYLLSTSHKKDILRLMKETDMHKELAILFEKMYGNKAQVHNTHGQNEFGRDIIISEKGPIKTTNTAVVVKMDKLSGGNLDKGILDIQGQVQQCFEKDIKAKDGFHNLPIDHVFIVVFGEISNNATDNLRIKLTPYTGRYDVFSINEMFTMFEEHYADVFYGASGLHVLNEKYNSIENSLKDKRYYNPACFIEPNLKSFNKSKQEMVAISHSASDKKLRAETMGNNIFGKKETIYSLAKKFHGVRHDILIEGDAGSGKSIFSSKIVQHLIQVAVKEIETKNKTSKIKLPVMFRAGDLKNGKCERLLEMTESYYSASTMEYQISVLLIDGLDEVDYNSQTHIIDKASIICKEHNISLILTSRKSTLTRSLVESFEKFELVPFETAQAINFITKMATGNQALLSSLLKGLDQLKNQIPMYPMALALLFEIVEVKGEVPASITELYSQFIDIALGKYANSDGISILFEPSIKFDFLQELSYEVFYKNDVSFISRELFNDFLTKYVSTHSSIAGEEEFLYELSRISVLRLKIDNVEFSHKSFLDYFISSYFERNSLELFKAGSFDAIYTCYHSTLWEDITSFYFGIKKQIQNDDIAKIIECDPHENDFLSSLHRFGIGRLIQYAWNSKEDVKKEAIRTGIEEIFTLRELFYEYNTKMFEMELPKIVSDINLMHLISENYTSTFLEKEIKEVVVESIEKIKSGTNSKIDDEMYYFGALYVITNANSLDNGYTKAFIENFILIEEKLKADTSLPIVALLNTMVKKIKFSEPDEAEKLAEDLDRAQKKLRKKYQTFVPTIFSFKNEIERHKLNDLFQKNR